MKFKAKRSITVIIVAVLLLAVGLGVLSVSHNAKSMKQFVADGFILDAPAEVAVTEVNQQHYFSQGSKYQEKFDTKVLFKDANGEEVSIDINQFLHYADGSLGSFTKGVIMNLDDVGEEQFGYYSITPNTLLLKNGTSYEMSSRGEKMTISEFVWKISDTDYMIVSPEVTLKLSASQEITLPGYAQIKYVDSGIVRIVHQQGTYQTVSADSFLYTEGGAELNLVGKNFYQNGEPGLSLDSMALDDEDYIELDENADSPELKIPTFNVINGKDGAAGNTGVAGEQGEIGEDGEDGEEGEEGENGEEGVAGEEGLAGAQGNQGEDGVEGDEGIMGYDGAEGEDGEDAQNGDDPIVAVDLLSRPTFNMDASDSYEVTADSVSMLLNMNDPDGSFVGNGTTKIEVYDRATMERVNTDEEAAMWGSKLESTADLGGFNFTQKGLNPDTEYVVVVKGQYVVAEGVPAMDATLYTKIFKTDALGIVLYKDAVTEDSVSVKSEVTASNVTSYMVNFFQYEESTGENGEKQKTKKTLAFYDGLTGTYVSVFDKDKPTGTARPVGDYALASNTTYYAEIANVMVGDEVMNAGDTVVELTTLKKKPYYKEMVDELDPDTQQTVAKEKQTPVTAMVPTATLNAKTHSIIVSHDSIYDDDNGVTGYRYELYRQNDIDNAVSDGALTDLTPAYTKSMQNTGDVSFSIPEGDNSNFVARVVVEFNDNEKDVEFSTMFSEPVLMTESASNLLVQFVGVSAYTNGVAGIPDGIRGQIEITGPTELLQDNIDSTNPLILTVVGEYNDVIVERIDKSKLANPGTTGDGPYLYNFDIPGLHKNSVYTLSVSGPWDTSGDGTVDAAEKETYLAGMRTQTSNTSGYSMAFRTVNNMATVAFAQTFYLTSPETAGTQGQPEVGFYEYEAKITNKIEFELIHVLDNGVEVKMGNNAVVKDTDPNIRDSVFFDSCWVERNDTNVTKDPVDGSLTATNIPDSHGYVLTPKDFGLDNNDSRFFSGGKFMIRALIADDYTATDTKAGNEIPFVNGENVVIFKISKRHVQATDPNTQVSAAVITNSGARDGYAEEGKADDTIVGVRFQAEYPYTDVLDIKYYIYELADSESGNFAGQFFYEDDADGGHPGTLVLTAEQTIGQSGQYRAPEIELYFDGTQSYNASNIATIWKDKEGDVVTDRTILERGKRYYIRYEVTADAGMIDCSNDGNNDKYPACSYNPEDKIPYYRSSIIEFTKQKPEILRYPYTSTDKSATWMYRVIDPDGAVTGGFMLKKGNTADAAAGATATTFQADVSGYLTDYAQLTIPGLNDNDYYAVSLNYQLSSTAQTQSIISAPVLFKSKISSVPSEIRAQGIQATSDTPEENKNADGNEKAIINEGGYRYKLTLQGTDIKKYAAYKVTFADTEDPSKKVVFDPVYPDYIGTLTAGGDYAILYMDASPVTELVKAHVTTVDVKVDGYYNTYENGVYGFTSDEIGDTSLGNENLFALKMYQEDGSAYYRKLSNNAWISVSDSVSGSVVLPGHDDGQTGFTMDSDDKKTATMTMRYATAPLSVSDTALRGLSEGLVINQNGMRVTSMANTAYYTVEKLGKKEEITFKTEADKRLVIGEILPAVEKVEITPGATSAFLKFKTLGTGATTDSKIYAKVYDGTNNLFKLEQKNEGEQGNKITYYQATPGGSIGDYEEGDIDPIPIYESDGNIYAELRIRGLQKFSDYKVVLFAYNANGEIVNLYSFDGKKTGYEYTFKTLQDIDITVTRPSYSYMEYDSKEVSFGFGIPGDEGTGKKIYYSIYEGSENGSPVGGYNNVYVEPLRSGSYEYYSQSPTQNRKIVADMNPTSGLRLNTTYVLVVRATSSLDESEELGKETLTFTTPASLNDPTFSITATSRKDEGNPNLVIVSATIASTDVHRSIMADRYTVQLIDKETGSPVKNPQGVERAASTNHSELVIFDDVPGGKEYIVKVTAEVDNDNDGTRDKEISQEYAVTALGNTTAQIGAAASQSQLYVTFSVLQGFESVTKIVITINDSSNGSQIMTDTFEVTEEMKESGTIEYINDWTGPEAGNYSLTVQYRDGSNMAIGNNKATVVVRDDGTGVSEGEQGAETTGFSLLSLRRQPVVDDSEKTEDETETEVEPEDETGSTTTSQEGSGATLNQGTTTETSTKTTTETSTETTTETSTETTTETTTETSTTTTSGGSEGTTTETTTTTTGSESENDNTNSGNEDGNDGGTDTGATE